MLLAQFGFTAAPKTFYSLIEKPVYGNHSEAFKYETADHRISLKFSLFRKICGWMGAPQAFQVGDRVLFASSPVF